MLGRRLLPDRARLRSPAACLPLLRYERASDRVRTIRLFPERKREFTAPPLHPIRFDIRKNEPMGRCGSCSPAERRSRRCAPWLGLPPDSRNLNGRMQLSLQERRLLCVIKAASLLNVQQKFRIVLQLALKLHQLEVRVEPQDLVLAAASDI